MIQRVLGAKDQYHAQMGVTFAGFLKLLIPFIVVIPGLIWFAIHPEMLVGQSLESIRPEADKTYVNLISLLIPIGLRGILLLALPPTLCLTRTAASPALPKRCLQGQQGQQRIAAKAQALEFAGASTFSLRKPSAHPS